MNQPEVINSREYWEHRFAGDWEASCGREQSRFFCRLAVEHFPDWLVHTIRLQRLSLCDWGCAEGDGTDVLAQFLERCAVTGVDFSHTAIEKARAYYPRLSFLAENFLESAREHVFDIVFSSNTLEHFPEPWAVFAKLSRYARQFVVLLLPYREFTRHAEHEVSFVARNIVLSPCEDWALIHSRVFDTGRLQSSYWPGEQILLIFARTPVLASLGLTLDNVCLNEDRWLEKVAQVKAEHGATRVALQAEIAARDVVLAERDAALAQHHEVVAEREQVVGERDRAIVERDAALAAQDALRTERDTALAAQDALRTERDAALAAQDALRAERHEALAARDTALAERDAVLGERAQSYRELEAMTAARDAMLAARDAALLDRDLALQARDNAYAARDWHLQMVAEMRASRSWRATEPLRKLRDRTRLTRHKVMTALRLLGRWQWGEIAYRVSRRGRKSGRTSHTAAEAAVREDVGATGAACPVPREPCLPEPPLPWVMMMVEQCDAAWGGIVDLCREFRGLGIATEIALAHTASQGRGDNAVCGIPLTTFDHDRTRFLERLKHMPPAVLVMHHGGVVAEDIADLGIPTVAVLHDMPPGRLADGWLERPVAPWILRYIAVSTHGRDLSITHYGIPEAAIRVIPRGLRPQGLVRPPMQRVTLQRRQTLSNPVIIHMADAGAQALQALVLAVFARIQREFPGAQLRLLGKRAVRLEQGDLIGQDGTSLGQEKNVEVCGEVSRRQLAYLLTHAHIALLSASSEGGEQALLECTYFGLPSVVLQAGASAHWLIDRFRHGVAVGYQAHPTWHTRPADSAVAEVTNAMLDILGQYEEFSQRGVDAARRYEEYSMASAAKEYLAVFRELSPALHNLENTAHATR